MPLFRRPQEPLENPNTSEQTSQPAILATPTCSYGGCDRQDVVQCGYRDRLAQRCMTKWCPDHGHMFDDRTFCIRHLNVTTALSKSPSRHMLPDLNNRAAGLAAWVSNDINAGVNELLTALLDPNGNEIFEVEPLVFNVVTADGTHHWERAWHITNSGRARVTVAVDVAEEQSDMVRVRVDGREIMNSVPPWIAAFANTGTPRPTQEENLRMRQDYYAEILQAVSRSVTQG